MIYVTGEWCYLGDEGTIECWPAVALGRPWNGWETPYFDRATADLIVKAQQRLHKDGAQDTATMEWDGDTIVVDDRHWMNDPDAVERIPPNDAGNYGLSLGWVWSRLSEDESATVQRFPCGRHYFKGGQL